MSICDVVKRARRSRTIVPIEPSDRSSTAVPRYSVLSQLKTDLAPISDRNVCLGIWKSRETHESSFPASTFTLFGAKVVS